MEQIRERIAEQNSINMMGKNYHELSTDEQGYMLFTADQILSLTLRRGGGVCDYCEGSGDDVWGNPPQLHCPKCKGTGELPVEEKSVGEIIKRWDSQP